VLEGGPARQGEAWFSSGAAVTWWRDGMAPPWTRIVRSRQPAAVVQRWVNGGVASDSSFAYLLCAVQPAHANPSPTDRQHLCTRHGAGCREGYPFHLLVIYAHTRYIHRLLWAKPSNSPVPQSLVPYRVTSMDVCPPTGLTSRTVSRIS